MRTPIEIKAVIKKLQQSKKEQPVFNMFGEPVHQGIDAKIDVLKNNLFEQDVINKYGEEYDGDDGTPNYIAGEAMKALRYLNQEDGYEEII